MSHAEIWGKKVLLGGDPWVPRSRGRAKGRHRAETGPGRHRADLRTLRNSFQIDGNPLGAPEQSSEVGWFGDKKVSLAAFLSVD